RAPDEGWQRRIAPIPLGRPETPDDGGGVGAFRAGPASHAMYGPGLRLAGRYVAPGVIDLHTHYDAQPFWDKLCTSSIWHGVTTVLTGNCGLTLAPLRPEHRDAMLATFCCVEDIPVR